MKFFWKTSKSFFESWSSSIRCFSDRIGTIRAYPVIATLQLESAIISDFRDRFSKLGNWPNLVPSFFTQNQIKFFSIILLHIFGQNLKFIWLIPAKQLGVWAYQQNRWFCQYICWYELILRFWRFCYIQFYLDIFWSWPF